jgi:hypothetical protein
MTGRDDEPLLRERISALSGENALMRREIAAMQRWCLRMADRIVELEIRVQQCGEKSR